MWPQWLTYPPRWISLLRDLSHHFGRTEVLPRTVAAAFDLEFALGEALRPDFKHYSQQIVDNAKTLTINVNRKLTSTPTGSVTDNGTITGSGTLLVQNNALGTGGTLSSIVDINALNVRLAQEATRPRIDAFVNLMRPLGLIEICRKIGRAHV